MAALAGGSVHNLLLIQHALCIRRDCGRRATESCASLEGMLSLVFPLLSIRCVGCRRGEHRQPVHKLAVRNSRLPHRSEGTRLNSSHGYISYAVFCLKKKKKNVQTICSV